MAGSATKGKARSKAAAAAAHDEAETDGALRSAPPDARTTASPPRRRSTATAPRASSRSATRRAASARPRRPSTWPPRSPSYGRQVLAVDFDPQGALSAGLGIQTHDVPDDLRPAARHQARPARGHRADLASRASTCCPANIDLSAAEVHLVNEVARETILARVLRKVAPDYDVILIDCQPSLGLLTVNALTASHGVVIPLECEFFALRGVALLIETIDKVRDRLNPTIELDGVLATMYDPRTLHSREVLERVVDAFGDDVLETVIGRTVKFPDASVSGMPITEFAPEHAAAQAYLRLARELVARGAVA